jgi:hypothetical protein
LVEAMLESESIPEYARPALQRDLDTLQAFDKSCLESRRDLALPRGGLTSHESLRDAIRASLEI